MGWFSSLGKKGAKKGARESAEGTPAAPEEGRAPPDREGQDQIATLEGTTAITEAQAKASGDDVWAPISKKQAAIQVGADLKLAVTDTKKAWSDTDSANFWGDAEAPEDEPS
jgi:hypothetical protein